MRTWLLILSCCLLQPVFAQKETAHWFLNNNHITIDPSGINNVSPSGISFSFNPFYTSTSVSDAAGNLLFAFSGNTIIDRNYNVMQGSVAYGFANVTSFVSLAVNIPGSSSYYLFYSTVNSSAANSPWTVKYALIDMSLNGGLGKVTAYDQVVASDLSEAFTLVQGDNTTDNWLVTHRSATDTFLVYKIDAAGLSNTPVVSKAGTVATTQDYLFTQLKTSPNGKMIAGTTYRVYPGLFGGGDSWFSEVFNFDALTGTLTSKIRTPRLSAYNTFLESVEFSADNRLLYVGSESAAYGLQPCGFGSSTIRQYNLCYTDSVDFYKYGMTIASDFVWCGPGIGWGYLQMGADKKIHTIYSGTTMPAIDYPNRIGSSSKFDFPAYSLSVANNGNRVTPSFHHRALEKAIKNNIVYTGGCFPNPLNFSITNDTITSVSWDFGDPAGSGNTITAAAPSHVFSAPGIYTVTAKLYGSAGQLLETVTEKVEIKDPLKRLLAAYPTDTSICAYNSFTMKLNVINGIFHWTFRPLNNPAIYDDGTADSLSTGGTSGTYYVEMRQNDCNGCILKDSIHVNVLPVPNVNLGYDQMLCTGDSIKLGFSDPAASYLWSTGSTASYIWVKQGGTYWVRGEYNNNGCPKRDTIVITQLPGVAFSLPNDTTLCSNQSLLLSPGIANAYYTWQDGSTKTSFNVTQPGKYWVRVTSNDFYCTKSDTINVSYINAQQVSLGRDSILCQGDSLVLSTSIANAGYLWSDGSTGDSLVARQSGSYWIKVNNGSCTVADTINLTFNAPPYVYLGKDTSLCDLQKLVLHAGVANAAYLWQNGSVADTLAVSQAGDYWLRVKKDGCTVRDTITISYRPLPPVSLGNDTAICAGSSLLLNAYNAAVTSYTWQDNSTQSSYTVSGQGVYWVSVTGGNGCIKTDTIAVSYKPLPVFDLGSDTTLCEGQALSYRFTLANASYLWNTGAASGVFTISQPGLYWLEATQNGCSRRDSITVAYQPLPVVNLGNDTTQCEGTVKLLDAYNPGATYLWNNGASTASISVGQPGQYIVAVTLNGCMKKDSIQVYYTYIPQVSLGADTELCTGQSFILDPKITNAGYLWQDGSTAPSFKVTQPGVYSVTVTNNCGSGSAKMTVVQGLCQLLLPNVFTPNHDGNNDLFRVKNPGFIKTFHMQVFSRWGQLVYNSTDARSGWDGKYHGQDMAAGNYVWMIWLVDLEGNAKMAKGSVLLLR